MKELIISKPLYQQMYSHLKKSILNGEIKPGQKVVASQLVEKYKISRTPLREALRQLEKEGLLVQDYTTLRVIDLNIEDFKELYECRLILEKEAMKLVVENITNDKLEEIKLILDEADQQLIAKDYLSLLELNTSFHDKLLEASSNKRLVDLLQQVRSFLLLYRAQILKDYDYNYEINEEHRTIYNALVKRDVLQVIQLIEEHIKNDMERGNNILKEIS